ncbi:MAG: HEPN domain-containing protein [Synechococcus sp.]
MDCRKPVHSGSVWPPQQAKTPRWRIAIADLQTAEASSDPVVFREGAWGFWLQQAVEKARKAWLLQLGGDPPFTHDLRRQRLVTDSVLSGG